jgi:putative ABC transport system permease protein
MLRNYLRVFGRILIRHKGFSVINVLGLALGFACFTLISIYITHESGFDDFHPGADRLYRVNKSVETSGGAIERHALTAGLLAPALDEAFPEVDATARVQPWFDDVLISAADGSGDGDNETGFPTPDVAIVDASFFDVFGFELIRGNPTTALAAPRSIVLTESVAARIFGNADPIGQSVTALQNLDYTVTGVAGDPDPQSHLRFNALISWSSTLSGGGLEFDWMNRWITQAPFTYIRLLPDSDPAVFEAKLPAFYRARDPERAGRYTLFLQPITETYLRSTDLLYADATNRGAARNVETFAILRFLILFIAAINFVNLSTARGSSRQKEIGVRSAVGANRRNLTSQFLLEAVGYSLLGFLVALALVVPALAALGRISGVAAFSAGGLTLSLLGTGLLLAVTLGLVAGIYPALILSRIRVGGWFGRASGRVSGRVSSRASSRMPHFGGSAIARNAFVVVQFAIAMILVAGTLIVLRQLSYAISADKGFAADQLIVLETGDTDIQQQFAAFTEEVRSHPAILNAAGSNSVPGASTSTFEVAPDGIRRPDVPFIANIVRVDDFALRDTYDFELVAGRYFDEAHPSDATNGVVVNEALARSLGWADPIDDIVGRRLDIVGELEGGEVIGVVGDYQFQSIHQVIAPLAFYYAPRGGSLTVRVSPDAVANAVGHLEATWQKFEPRYPFAYTFLDESFERYYASEARLMKLLSVFSVLALLVAALGLYGLAAYLTSVRTKEIGVRKVLGARVSQIVLLFVRDFARLVGLAIVLATPFVVVGSSRWLEGYAYRAPVGVGVYAVAAAIVLGVALVSTCWQPVRAARANPVKALRYE